MASKATIFTATQFQATRNGIPLAFGTVDIFRSGTVDRANSWRDSNKIVLNTNPVVLDAEGKANIYLEDTVAYDITIKDKEGSIVKSLDAFESNVPLETEVNLSLSGTADTITITNTAGDNATLAAVTTATAGIMSASQYQSILENKTDTAELKADATEDVWDELVATNDQFAGSWFSYRKIGRKTYTFVSRIIWLDTGNTDPIFTLPFSLPFDVSFSSHSHYPQAQNDIIGGNGQMRIGTDGVIYFYRGANTYSQYANGVFTVS
jgi:hypothetical protein